jgi:5-methylcytosine-specific restriction endonuclease McrA
MPIARSLGLNPLAKPLTSEEGNRVLERDQYRCQYCGLDGMSVFENYLIMTVDFVHPRIRKGAKNPDNLVCACRPCNTIKGHRVFANLEEAKAFVLKKREELRARWEAQMNKPKSRTAAGPTPS